MFVNKIMSMGPDACRPGKTSWVDGDGLHVHPDYLRLAVLELLEETNCSYCLHSPVTGDGIQLSPGSQRLAVLWRCFGMIWKPAA